jgi:hypothetical protein
MSNKTNRRGKRLKAPQGGWPKQPVGGPEKLERIAA